MVLDIDCIDRIYDFIENMKDRQNFREAFKDVCNLKLTDIDLSHSKMMKLFPELPTSNTCLGFSSLTLRITDHKVYHITKTDSLFGGLYDVELIDTVCYIPWLDMYVAPNAVAAADLMLTYYPAERQELYHVSASGPYCSVACTYNGVHMNHPLAANADVWSLRMPQRQREFDTSWICHSDVHNII